MLDAALKDGTAHRRCTFEDASRSRHDAEASRRGQAAPEDLEALERFEFDDEQIEWLSSQGIISEEAASFLATWRFTGDMWGYAEGECYFPGSPLLTVEGSFADCTLLETLLLSILNHDCAVASAASRMTIAAHGRPCMDMGARRAHERAAVSAARAAIIGGFQGTSDLEAAKRYGIHAIGTAAHAFTLLHDSERDAFDSQVASLGAGTTLLVDTYDIAQGVVNAVEAARAAGGELGAVRLDSGDLVAQAFKVRGQLDAMGATSTKITVTSDLDEYAIAALGAAPVDSYGVGTRLVTGSGVPTAALVYKVVSREDASGAIVPVAKKSESKSTVGGRKVAGRVMGDDGYASEELLLVGTSMEEGQKLLAERGARPLQVPLVRQGVIDSTAWSPDALARAQEHHLRARNELPYQAWRLSEGEVAIPTRYEAIA